MLDVSVFGLLPLLVNLTKCTHPKIKRASLCLDRLWPMLIFSVSSKPMKSRNVISKYLVIITVTTVIANDGTVTILFPSDHSNNKKKAALKPRRAATKRVTVKMNPLKNIKTMLKLNPYAAVQKRAAQKASSQ